MHLHLMLSGIETDPCRSAFEVTVILFEFSRQRNARRLAQLHEPDLSLSATISEICQFIPGVTGSLLAFLLFGTTAQFNRKYIEAFRGLRRSLVRRRPSLNVTHGDSWDYIDAGGAAGSYECTVRAKSADGREVDRARPRSMMKSQEGVERGIVRDKHRNTYIPQPWRSLGMSKP